MSLTKKITEKLTTKGDCGNNYMEEVEENEKNWKGASVG
jgi:hypothetical protein